METTETIGATPGMTRGVTTGKTSGWTTVSTDSTGATGASDGIASTDGIGVTDGIGASAGTATGAADCSGAFTGGAGGGATRTAGVCGVCCLACCAARDMEIFNRRAEGRDQTYDRNCHEQIGDHDGFLQAHGDTPFPFENSINAFFGLPGGAMETPCHHTRPGAASRAAKKPSKVSA